MFYTRIFAIWLIEIFPYFVGFGFGTLIYKVNLRQLFISPLYPPLKQTLELLMYLTFKLKLQKQSSKDVL